MIKGILLDWQCVLVVNDNSNQEKTREIYTKILKSTAIEDEIVELVKSYKKYEHYGKYYLN